MRRYFGSSAAALTLCTIGATSASAQVRTFNIPAQPLAAAITAFGRQSRLQIVAPTQGIDGVRSRPIHGVADARVALRRLIDGTPLSIASDAGGRIVLVRTAEPAAATDPQTGAEPAAQGDIVVTGLRASLQTARETKRRSDAIVDVVAAEDINQLPDNSATEALARVPGVQIFRNRGEGQAFTLRGLSQVLTTLNGQESYTGSSRRSLLNSYPSNLIRSINVYKALTPDLVEGGIGGAIDVQLRQPLDLPRGITIAGTIRGSYDDQARKPFYNADVLVSGRWQTGIGEIGVLINASYLRRDYLESYRESLQPQATTATQRVTPAGLGSGLLYPTTILVKRPQGHYTRPVVTGALQWRPNPNLGFRLRVTDITDDNTYYDNDLQTAVAANAALSNVVLKPDSKVIESASFVAPTTSGPRSQHTRQLLDTTQIEWGADYQAGIATLTTSAVYTLSRTNTDTQLFLLAFNQAPTIDAAFQSDSKWGGLSYTYRNVDLTDPNIFHVRAYSDQIIRAKGSGLQWRSDVELAVGDGFVRRIKTGFRYADRSTRLRQNTALANLDALGLPMSAFPGGATPRLITGGFHGDDVAIPDNWAGYDARFLDTAAGLAALNGYVATLPGQAAAFGGGRPAFDSAQSFDGDETSYASYGQVKYGLRVAGVDIDGVVGARIVNTQLSIRGTQRNTIRGVVTLLPIDDRQNYLDVDPSASAVIHLSRQVQLRAAYTKTFTRPDFAQLNPSVVLVQTNAATGTASAGNPNLRPIRSTNYDASLEYYFGRAGSASVALFRRDLDGFVVNTIRAETLDGATGTILVTRPENASDGRVDGLEVQVSTFFDFAPGLLRNVGMSGNYTLLDTEQTVPAVGTTPKLRDRIAGISRTSWNTALFYDDGRWRLRAAYAWRSDFTLAYNAANRANDLNWYPISRLDASLTYRMNRAMSLTLDGTNLLGRPQRAYWGTKDVIDRVYFEGRVLSAALRFKY